MVHCSDGVGRTGTMIAILTMVAQHEADAAGEIDVFRTVFRLRECRPLMVRFVNMIYFLCQLTIYFVKGYEQEPIQVPLRLYGVLHQTDERRTKV